MSRLIISEDSRSEDLADLAIALNEIVRLPITMRGMKHPGVRVENGKVLDEDYTGPILEEVIRTGKAIRTVPKVVYMPVFRYRLHPVLDGHTVAIGIWMD